MPIFSAALNDPKVQRHRAQVLERIEWFPAAGLTIRKCAASQIHGGDDEFTQAVGDAGAAVAILDRALSVPEFIKMAEQFGETEPETDDSLMSRVDERVVLNLVPDSVGLANEENRPFSPRPLTFHIEGSRRPLGTAPSYVLFQCLVPPSRDQGNQTILRPIDEVLDLLAPDALVVLGGTVLGPRHTTSPIVYEHAGSRRLNFRDPWPEPFDLESVYDEETVLWALVELMTALYRSEGTIGVPWLANTLVVVDNRKWLHARTRGLPGHRHLQRIRIKSLDGQGGSR